MLRFTSARLLTTPRRKKFLLFFLTLHSKFNILYVLNLVFVIKISHSFKEDVLSFFFFLNNGWICYVTSLSLCIKEKGYLTDFLQDWNSGDATLVPCSVYYLFCDLKAKHLNFWAFNSLFCNIKVGWGGYLGAFCDYNSRVLVNTIIELTHCQG